ncbi:inner centromere protein-like [Myotis yumanensis]|uniref:inner centromere protein-like n=1 Tax=Myotis yumanensis TaxID=159337 RepID=UPI0038CF61FD
MGKLRAPAGGERNTLALGRGRRFENGISHRDVCPEEDPSEEAEPMEEAGPEVPKNEESTLWPRGAPKTVISTPGSQPAAGGQDKLPVGQREAKIHQTDGPEEPPQSIRRKQSCRRKLNNKEAVSELDGELPRSKTPSPPCPASKVVQPVRTFLHTMQRNQMLMTPTSASRSRVIKSFVKRNTPLRVDPKEKEQQRLENLRRKEEAEQLRRLKVEEDKRRRLEELKLKREERLRKVLQARERAEQMREEKIKQIEQRIAPQEKNEKAKEERLAEEKAKKMAAAKKMEVRRKQEEEARRLRCLHQEEEEQQRKKEEEDEQERLLKAAEARRLAEQREQEQRREQERLQAERELQEREKALWLQTERELEEKKKEKQQRLQEEQEKKAKEAAAASKGPNTTMDVQSPAHTLCPMTPQGPRAPPKTNLDNYGMDLNSDDSTDDESHPRKPVPSWATGTQLSQAILHQYCHPPNLPELFGTIRQLDLEDIFKKSKPRYHKRTSSAVWNSPPVQGSRVPSSLTCSLKH